MSASSPATPFARESRQVFKSKGRTMITDRLWSRKDVYGRRRAGRVLPLWRICVGRVDGCYLAEIGENG
jgi:hypothetical protein